MAPRVGSWKGSGGKIQFRYECAVGGSRLIYEVERWGEREEWMDNAADFEKRCWTSPQ